MNPVLVYGNHRAALALLEDYFEYFQQCFEGTGQRLDFSAEPLPGRLNILIDQFDIGFVEQARKLHSEEGARFLLVATEFITGDTFNNFGFNRTLGSQIGSDAGKALKTSVRSAIGWVPGPVRDMGYKLFPQTYLKAKSRYSRSAHEPKVIDFSDLRRFWKERFDCFSNLASFSQEIWCVSPHQVGEYQARFGEKVRMIPIVSWSETGPKEIPDKNKDIDFLFTGSLTPYRKGLIESLTREGFNVAVGTPDWPQAVREHYVARAKVCLHLRQGPDWRFPSIMRLHYLLTRGCTILAEAAPEHCSQEAFLTRSESSKIVEAGKKLVSDGNFSTRGNEALLAYYHESEPGRNEVREMIQSLKS